ncbi:MAG: divalent-cation tolerance protein CutA [Methylococcales bacterium]|nr:divalent-cation tolerance protein CutA [Methylococcales bacterium]
MKYEPGAHQLVLCTCPDRGVAKHLAEMLLVRQLAACVNVIPGLESLYYWEGALQCDAECLLLIKTDQNCYSELEALLLEQHSYDVPEIIALPITHGSSTYLQWLDSCLKK